MECKDLIEGNNSFTAYSISEVMATCLDTVQHCSDIGICYQCFSGEHVTQDCEKVLSTRAYLRRNKLCFNCEKSGHGYLECPEPLKPELRRYKEKLEARRGQQSQTAVNPLTKPMVNPSTQLTTQQPMVNSIEQRMDALFERMMSTLASRAPTSEKQAVINKVDSLTTPLTIHMVEYEGRTIPEYGVRGVGSSKSRDEIILYDQRNMPTPAPGMIDTGASVNVCPGKYASFCQSTWTVDCLIKCANGSRSHITRAGEIRVVVNCVDLGYITVLLCDEPG